MKAEYIESNNAWILVFGDSLIDLDGQRFFDDLDQLNDELAQRGMALCADHRVIMENSQ